jgi:hypothetical protein
MDTPILWRLPGAAAAALRLGGVFAVDWMITL